MGAGDVDAELAAFCAERQRDLVGLLALLTGDRFVAEELAQEALARCCEHWPRVRTLARPDAWLWRVARNLAASRFRRRAAERRANARVGETGAVNDPDGGDAVAIRQAVAALPRRQREVLVLRWYLGSSVSETAQELSCAEGTVKSLTHKAMANLRHALELEEVVR